MSDLKELIAWVEDLGEQTGVQVFLIARPGDYLMLQSQNLDIPLMVEFDPAAGVVRANGRSGDRWSTAVWATAPALMRRELLEVEIRFSADGAEVWIANSLRLHFPMRTPAKAVRKVFGTSSFTYGGTKPTQSPAPVNYRSLATTLEDISERKTGSDGSIIYDLGMKDGSDTQFYLEKGFRVVAIEPNATTAAEAVRRFAPYLAKDKLTILNMAVAAEEGRYPFYINNVVPNWSSLNRQIANRAHQVTEVTVSGASLPDIVRRCGKPYYVKLSTEGYDNLVLASVGQLSERPKFISTTELDISLGERLFELGYTMMKLVSLRSIPLMQCPNPAREGASISHKFRPYSSGLFGDETPGVWLTGATAQRAIRAAADAQSRGLPGDRDTVIVHAAKG
jgi:FkbM family methyltransferase